MRGPWIGCAPTTQPKRRISPTGFELYDLDFEPAPEEPADEGSGQPHQVAIGWPDSATRW